MLWGLLCLLLACTRTDSFVSCGMGIPAQCQCSNHTTNAVNIYCSKIGMSQLPNLDFGLTPIHTFSLEDNNLTSIQTGDFFGLKISRLLLKRNRISELNMLAFWGLEYYLDSLDISYNKLTRVPGDALRLLRNLHSLSLEGNMIETLFNNDLAYLERLEVLSLDNNPLKTIEADAFSGTNILLLSLNIVDLSNGLQSIPTKHLGTLRGLSVANNAIEDIPNKWFKGVPSLRSLNLDANRIHSIPPNTFQGIETSLKTLELNENKLKKIPKHTLRKLTNLEGLELSHNRIKKIHARSFNASRKLVTLDLSNNHLEDISPIAFEGMNNIEKIDLRHNGLITLDERTVHWPGSRLQELFLADNQWLCNCLLQWLKRDYKKQNQRSELFVDLHLVTCIRPDYLNGRQLVRIPMRELTCDHDYYYYYEEDYPEAYDTYDNEYYVNV